MQQPFGVITTKCQEHTKTAVAKRPVCGCCGATWSCGSKKKRKGAEWESQNQRKFKGHETLPLSSSFKTIMLFRLIFALSYFPLFCCVSANVMIANWNKFDSNNFFPKRIAFLWTARKQWWKKNSSDTKSKYIYMQSSLIRDKKKIHIYVITQVRSPAPDTNFFGRLKLQSHHPLHKPDQKPSNDMWKRTQKGLVENFNKKKNVATVTFTYICKNKKNRPFWVGSSVTSTQPKSFFFRYHAMIWCSNVEFTSSARPLLLHDDLSHFFQYFFWWWKSPACMCQIVWFRSMTLLKCGDQQNRSHLIDPQILKNVLVCDSLGPFTIGALSSPSKSPQTRALGDCTLELASEMPPFDEQDYKTTKLLGKKHLFSFFKPLSEYAHRNKRHERSEEVPFTRRVLWRIFRGVCYLKSITPLFFTAVKGKWSSKVFFSDFW